MTDRDATDGTRARRRGAIVGAAACAALAAVAACGESREAPPLVGSGRDGPSVGARPGAALPDVPLPPADRGPRQVGVVQIAAFPDSAAALRLRDSLDAAGWRATVRAVMGDSLPPWRVRVAPTADRELMALVAEGWSRAGRRVQVVGDTASLVGATVRVHVVNRGDPGVRGGVRWTFGPGRRALVVVEGTRGSGGAPAPDAFVYAAETRPSIVQRDSVWDVAPDADWSRLAFGRAFLVRTDGRDAASAGPWLAIAGRSNLNPSEIRRGAFPVTRDGSVRGFAQPVIEPLAADSVRQSLERAVSDPVPMAGGWRVRWSADGRTLGVGLAPDPALADDAPPRRWLAVNAEARLAQGDVPSYVRLVSPAWVQGATFDSTARTDAAARTLDIAGGEVRSAGGWITVRGTVTGGTARVIGPGTALAATAGGRFVAALAPAGGRRPGEPALRVVVYEIAP